MIEGSTSPIEGFPAWFRIPAQLSPLTHIVRIARAAALNHFDTLGVGGLIYVVTLTLAFFLLSALLMKRRLIK